jgi:poly(3-hydroxybutyrate) depolymerase
VIFSASTFPSALLRSLALASLAVLCATILPAQSSRPILSHFSLSVGCGKAPAPQSAAPLPASSQPVSTGLSSSSNLSNLSKVETKDGRGFRRTYLMLLPKNYDPHKTYSLVLVFHGSGATSEASMSWGLQDAHGAADSAVFLFPQGFSFQSNPAGWDNSERGYDTGFFDGMVSDVEEAYCIDRDEVFAMGFSWGGDFVKLLACARGDTVRAVAVNSAGDDLKDHSDFRSYRALPCPSRIHPAVRFVHAVDGDSAYAAPEFATTSQLYQFLNQCSASSKPVTSSTDVMTCKAFDGCAKQYVECSFNAKIGHALPPNWAQDTWDFFSSFRKTDRDMSHYR